MKILFFLAIATLGLAGSLVDAGRVRRDPQYSVYYGPHIHAHQLHNAITNMAYSLQNQIAASALYQIGNAGAYRPVRPIGNVNNHHVYAVSNGAGGVVASAGAYRPSSSSSGFSSGGPYSSGFRPAGNRPIGSSSGFVATGNRPGSVGYSSTSFRPNGVSASAVAVSNSG